MEYKFCEQLKNSVYFAWDSVYHCCNCGSQYIAPVVRENYKGEYINWKDVIKEKIALQDKAKKGEAYPSCKICHMWKSREWQDCDMIEEIFISHWTKCNCNCYYCFTAEHKNFHNTIEEYKLMPILLDMKNSGVLNFNALVRFIGGDVAMLDELNDFMNFFLENGTKNFYIPTSGIKYLPIIEKVLRETTSEVIISPDSADADLYKKIKRVDAFDTVMNNIKKYAAAKNDQSRFVLKYIILPYVNDNKKEIDKWLDIIGKLGIKTIAIDMEDNFMRAFSDAIPPHIPELVAYIEQRAYDMGLECVKFRFLFQLLYQIENGESKLLQDDSMQDVQRKFVEKMLVR